MKPDTTAGAWVALISIMLPIIISIAIVLILALIYCAQTIIEAILTLTKRWWWNE
jgi:hypothetical protein